MKYKLWNSYGKQYLTNDHLLQLTDVQFFVRIFNDICRFISTVTRILSFNAEIECELFYKPDFPPDSKETSPTLPFLEIN